MITYNAELTSFVGRSDTIVLVSDQYEGSTRVAFIDGRHVIMVSKWLCEKSLKNKKWARALRALLMHEKGHIVHGDCRRKTAENAHQRDVPVLSEAHADRYACICGFGRDLIMAEKMIIAKNWAWLHAGDMYARIKLIKRWLKNHA